MNVFKKRIGIAWVMVAGLLAGGVASAAPIAMDFDGLTPGTSVHNYYNGGCSRTLFGTRANCSGPDYGVVWKGATVGSSAGAPSPSGFAGLLLNDQATMNIAVGFDGGLSFDYYNLSNFLFSGSVSVYSGLNGRGAQLSYADLGTTNGWDFFDLTFSGLARSVIFSGSPFYLTGFDNVTLGVNAPTHPVPEPAALGVFGLGVLLLGLFAGLRRRYN